MKDELMKMAIDNLDNSYAPYSKYYVSCALLSEEGEVFLGNNIENASYGDSICAERVAFFKAVSRGYRKFKAIAIVSKYMDKIREMTFPCGSCRQVMSEFVDDDFSLFFLKNGNILEYKFKEILPYQFGKDKLEL